VAGSCSCEIGVPLTLLARDTTQNAVCRGKLYVRPSVCLSVALRYRGHSQRRVISVAELLVTSGYAYNQDNYLPGGIAIRRVCWLHSLVGWLVCSFVSLFPPNIPKTVGDRRSVPMDNQYEMAYGELMNDAAGNIDDVT